jgi:hypothetical protein
MEPENSIRNTKPHNALFTVTPLSKYFAMFLFVALPFVAGWIGYTYAPEKVVEVEKVVVMEDKTTGGGASVTKDSISALNSWSEFTIKSLGVHFKYPPEFRVIDESNTNNKYFEYTDDDIGHVKGERIATVLDKSITGEKDNVSLTVSMLKTTTPFPFRFLTEDKVGTEVSFNEYEQATRLDTEAFLRGEKHGVASMYTYKLMTINDIPVLLYKRNYHGLIGDIYDAYVPLKDGRFLEFSSEVDNNILEKIYLSLKKDG